MVASISIVTLPNPLNLLLRTLIVSGVVLGLAQLTQHTLIQPLTPLIRGLVAEALPEFTIQSLDLAQDGPNDTLRLRANLKEPLNVSGRMFYPVGYGTDRTGGYEITLTVGGAVQYSLVLLIVILAWPHQTSRELVRRGLFGIPLMIGLVLLNAAITLPAEVWHPIHDEWLPDIPWTLLTASRVLMGGGGVVLGIVGGVAVIALSKPRAAANVPSLVSHRQGVSP